MMKLRLFGIMTILAMLFIATGTTVLAQEATETPAPVPPATFTDGRISTTAGLGGLALYCVDSSGIPGDSFEGGAITVWGVGDQKYIELSAVELRGSVEVAQEPSVMEMEGELTVEAPAVDAPMMDATVEPEATDMIMPEATPLVLVQEPILLARATTPNGEIGFFRIGDDRFALQGHDDKGAFFTYTWTGCSSGVIEHTTGAFLPFLEAPVVVEMNESEMVTPEATEGM
jgi:hypothetical protein